MISNKIHNYNYAPGIATYGVDGKTGANGQDGTTLFYTSYDITSQDDLHKFISALKLNKLPIYNNETPLLRTYTNGDLFFDSVGRIYKLYDIDYVKGDAQSANATSFKKFMKLAGQIQLEEDNSIVKMSDSNRLVLGSTYTGMDINASGDSDYALRVSASQTDGNQYILKLQTTYGDNVSSSLNFYYDSTLQAYHIMSDKPILLDADVKIQNGSSDTIDGYSSIQTIDDKSNSISLFYNYARGCKIAFKSREGNPYNYQIDTDNSDFSILEQNAPQVVKDGITVRIMYYDRDVDVEKTDSDTGYIEDNSITTFMGGYYDESGVSFVKRFNDKFVSKHINIKSVSFIYNIECYVPYILE